MSVSPPTARAKSSVGSKMGGRISPKPKVAKTAWAVSSTWFQRAVSGGRRSRVPRMAWNLGGGSFFGAASVTRFVLGYSSNGRLRKAGPTKPEYPKQDGDV